MFEVCLYCCVGYVFVVVIELDEYEVFGGLFCFDYVLECVE